MANHNDGRASEEIDNKMNQQVYIEIQENPTQVHSV